MASRAASGPAPSLQSSRKGNYLAPRLLLAALLAAMPPLLHGRPCRHGPKKREGAFPRRAPVFECALCSCGVQV